MANNVTIGVRPGYTPYFSFKTGFKPKSEIASTSFGPAGQNTWLYTITYNDGSKVDFNMPDDDGVVFEDSILVAAPLITEVRVFDPEGTEVVDLLADAAGWSDWEGSILAPDFVEKWMADNNTVAGTVGSQPDNTILEDQRILGYGGSDNIYGGAGDDTMDGGAGSDTASAGAGSDTFVFGGSDFSPGEKVIGTHQESAPAPGEVNTLLAKVDVDFRGLSGVVGINRIVFDGATTLTFANRLGSNIGYDLNGVDKNGLRADTEVVGDGGPNALVMHAQEGNLNISDFRFTNWTAGQDAVTIVGRATTGNRLFAPDAATEMTGAGFADTMTGGDGDDRLSAFDGEDRLSGGRGRDVLDGGGGRDSLEGGNSNDTLLGGDGIDTLNGGSGSDSMVGGLDDDIYHVDATGDRLVETTGGGSDLVVAAIDFTLADHFERLSLTGAASRGTGNTIANVIQGRDGGNDILSGKGGNDSISGFGGVDRLNGGNGDDELRGGLGGDRFIVSGAWGSDIIWDWQDTAGAEASYDGLDRISLRDLRGANDVDAIDDLLISQAGNRVNITLDLDHDGVTDARDLNGNGTPDTALIVVFGATAGNFGAADFLF